MPTYEEYLEDTKSEIADLQNSGKARMGTAIVGGAIMGAIFLKEFVGNTPWIHLDIAGTAYYPAAESYTPKRSTGWGVRLLVEYLKTQ